MSTLNPAAYQAVFDALQAIVAYDVPLRAGLLNQANNALHMAQLPVVPVSEDVEKDVKSLRMTIYFAHHNQEYIKDALAALDRLAAAAGRPSDR